MRYVLLLAVVLVAAPAHAQTAEKPKVSEWIGTLEFNNPSGLDVISTRVTLEGPPSQFTGRWLAKHSSGSLEGTTDNKGRMRVSVTMYSPAIDDAGNVIDPEGCVGKGVFTGTMYKDFVMRWTANEVTSGQCARSKRLVWTLQPLPRTQ